MQSSQHARGEAGKKGLLTGFPVRHLRYLRWLVKNYLSPPPSQWADPASPSVLHSHIVTTATYSPWLSDKQFLAVYENVKEHTLVDVYRCYELWALAKSVAQIPGSILEVGVWRGGTGAVLAAASPGKAVYLADTFHGVVKASTKDTRYRGGEHADTSKSQVERLLRSLHLTNSILLEGVFPEDTAHQVTGPIALLHSDVDVYVSTRDVVEWTLPRLSLCGVMVLDDYGFSGCEGVTTYVDELRESNRGLFFIHNLNGHAILIKQREEARSSTRLPATEKRRAHRVAASMPVLVYGHSAHVPFAEPATTANVSTTGGLVGLSTKVIRFQTLVITNLQTNEDTICRVARFIRNGDGNFVAVEFLHPTPHFWSIDFAGEPSRLRT